MSRSRRLKVVYILPSRYDEDGYVLRHWRGVLPSSTAGCLATLTRRLADTAELGRDVDLSVRVLDDTVEPVPVERIVRESRRRGTRVVVGLIGVQTGQFARATDLALAFRAAGVPVLIGGFHVSGVLALFDEPPAELVRLLDRGVTLVRGEVETPGVLARILRDALEDRLEPVYAIEQPPDLTTAPVPAADAAHLRRYISRETAVLDTSRGCPFNCSFCTIINVQGRRMRSRRADAILRSIEAARRRGIRAYFFTDDNLARSPVWEALFDGLIRLRRQGRGIRFMMQVDTRAAFIPGFVEKAAAAGCDQVFVGVESLNEANLVAAGKRQNRVGEFREMVEAWYRARVAVQAGYIIGLPHDTPESVRRDIVALRDAVRVDHASFFMFTPIPGSRDHRRMVEEKVPLDADLNDFDSFHETFRHPHFAPGEWAAVYREAWDTFYTKERIVDTLLRTPPDRYWNVFWHSLWTRYAMQLGTHPMVTGFVRRRERRSRRPGFPIPSRPRFLWERTKDALFQARNLVRLFFEFQEIWLLTRKRKDPRWSTLAALRERWAEMTRRVAESQPAVRAEVAARELRTTLQNASEQLRQLLEAGRSTHRRLRRRLREKRREIESFLEHFDRRVPSLPRLSQAERYVRENLLAGYEELAIRYVAARRRLNTLRHDLLGRLRRGRLFTFGYLRMPGAILVELFLGLRFGLSFLRNV